MERVQARGTRNRGRKAVLYDEARSFGLHDGFYLPIRQRDGSMMGVSMMASQKLPDVAHHPRRCICWRSTITWRPRGLTLSVA